MSASNYHVVLQDASARAIAAVRARVPADRVSRHFARYLDEVYAASRSSGIRLDGQNIFVYRDAPDGDLEVDFGVGTPSNFPAVGSVRQTETPTGTVATTTHWGDYGGLAHAHDAVIHWCNENGHQLAGPRWEVYGHWTDRPTELRTDVFYLLTATS
jgi:effector-binding domain-containing protein